MEFKTYAAGLMGIQVKKGCMHDKLVLIHKPDHKNKVIIGSAGFSENVQKNRNYENMLSISNDNAIFDYFKKHFDKLVSGDNLKIKSSTPYQKN